MPSPFEMGRAVGGNVGQAAQGYQEGSALDQILKNASASKNPQEMNNVMSQIIQNLPAERQPMAMQVLQNKAAQIQQEQQQQAASQYYQSRGMDPNLAKAPKEIQAAVIKQDAKVQSAKQIERVEHLHSALETVGNMRAIKAKGNLGPVFSVTGTGRKGSFRGLWSKEALADRAEYERLGKSLIADSSNLYIRNQKEFDVLRKDLDNVNANNETLDGVLNGMQSLLRSKLNATGQNPYQQQANQGQQQAQSPQQVDDLIRQALKQSGGDRTKAYQLLQAQGITL